MNERDEVLAIIGNLKLEDYFEIHGVQTVWSNGNKARQYRSQDKHRTGDKAQDGYRKMVAIYVEVRDE